MSAADTGRSMEKRESTAQARAALAGAKLIRCEAPSGSVVYLLCRWNLSRELASLDDVERVLDQIGAPA